MLCRARAVEVEEISTSRGELPGGLVAGALEDAAEVDGEVSGLGVSGIEVVCRG